MKILHREDVEEAGYDMPSTGICANIAEFDLEELKFAGEWIMADDEVVVADGHQQQYLYTVISGQVDVYKRNDQSSQHQHIATIAQGDAFGEMAFLSGGVASADVQATGQVVLWRIDHERLLEFVGQHRAGGQLCMNVASILSTRLVSGNSKLVDLGKQLQDSVRKLQSVSKSGPQNTKALRQMQTRVTGVTTAFAGKEVSKTQLGGLGIAAMAVAGISLVGLIISLVTRPDADAEQQVVALKDEKDDLARTHGKLVVQHKNLQDDKDRLRQRLDKSQDDQNELIALLQQNNAGVSQEILGKLAALENGRPPRSGLPEGPAAPTPKPTPAPPVTPRPPVQPEKGPAPTPPPTRPQPSLGERASVLAWAQRWSTVAFPTQVRAISPITLQAKGNSGAKVPVRAGLSLYALRIEGDKLLVGLKPTSNTFTQSVPMDTTNYVEVITPRYKEHAKRLAERAANTPTKGSPFPKPPPSTTSSAFPEPPSQKPPTKKPPLNDHGKSCVCKECRANKKGGSLFQFD